MSQNCSTKYCRNKAAAAGKCNTCRSREWRKNNPIKYAYQNLKHNAKRRGKEFSITFDQFKEFCVKVDYLGKKGITAEGYHIDRIREEDGYHIDNIQLLQNSDNVKKYMTFVRDGRGKPENFKFKTAIEPEYDPAEDLPF